MTEKSSGLVQQRSDSVVSVETDDGTGSVSTVETSVSATRPIVPSPMSEPLLYSAPQGSLKKYSYFLPLNEKMTLFLRGATQR